MKTSKFYRKTQIAVLSISILCSALIFAQNVPIKEGTATNCTFTGNSADYCNASNGQQNLKVINCKPGATSCYY